MEFAFVLLIVVVSGAWLGVRVYRFFRNAATPRQPGAPACSGCTACAPDKLDPSCAIAADMEESVRDQEYEEVR